MTNMSKENLACGQRMFDLVIEIEKYQCPSVRELPDDLKTHPTFIPSVIFEGVKAVLNIATFFWGHPV